MDEPSNELHATIEAIFERTLAMRDILVVLTAIVAKKEANPDRMFSSMSNGLSLKIDQFGQKSEALERVRAEIDWIVSAAHSLYQASNQSPSTPDQDL